MRANRDGYEHELVKDGGMENEALRGQRQLLRVASFWEELGASRALMRNQIWKHMIQFAGQNTFLALCVSEDEDYAHLRSSANVTGVKATMTRRWVYLSDESTCFGMCKAKRIRCMEVWLGSLVGLAPFIDTISRTLYPVILLLVNRLPHSSLVGIVMQCATSHKVSPFRIGMALARKFMLNWYKLYTWNKTGVWEDCTRSVLCHRLICILEGRWDLWFLHLD